MIPHHHLLPGMLCTQIDHIQNVLLVCTMDLEELGKQVAGWLGGWVAHTVYRVCILGPIPCFISIFSRSSGVLSSVLRDMCTGTIVAVCTSHYFFHIGCHQLFFLVSQVHSDYCRFNKCCHWLFTEIGWPHTDHQCRASENICQIYSN